MIYLSNEFINPSDKIACFWTHWHWAEFHNKKEKYIITRLIFKSLSLKEKRNKIEIIKINVPYYSENAV